MGNIYGQNEWDDADSYPQDSLYQGQDQRAYGQNYQNQPLPPASPPPPVQPGAARPSLAAPILGALVGVLVLGGGVGLGAWYLLGGKGGDDTRQASSQTQVSDSPSQTSPAGQPEAQAGAPVTATPISDSDRQSAQLGTVSSDCQSAPSVDDAGRRTTFDAANATDGDPATAWRCDGSGGGTFRFTLAQPTEVMDFGLIPGYAKTDPSTGVNRFHQNHTVTEATWTLDLADGGQLGFTQAIGAPSPDYHFMRLSQAQQVTGGSVTITGTGNPGAIRDFTPVSEIVLTTTTPSYNGE